VEGRKRKKKCPDREKKELVWPPRASADWERCTKRVGERSLRREG